MRTLITGDTHGNARWLHEYIYPVALALAADKIVVLGDFGYWEHKPNGVTFLNQVADLSEASGIPLYWLHGNHDKHSLTLAKYGDQRDAEGFIVCRPHVLYIPQGHAWAWQGRTFRSFGGAYSVDKAMRLVMELRSMQQPGSLWFPEEQMSAAQMHELLAADSSRKDFVLSHDKPLGSRPGWNRKDINECRPNQVLLQKALEVHRPQYWFHGHLHFSYRDVITAENDTWTIVMGLEPDQDAAEPGWRHEHTWLLLELPEGGAGPHEVVTPGQNVTLNPAAFQQAKAALA